MNQKLVVFSIVCSLAVLFPPEITATGMGIPGIIHWGTKGVVAGVHHTVVKSAAAAKGVGAGVKASIMKAPFVPIIVGKKALLMAPIAVPLALGGKALLAAKLALPMAVGAAVGAPVGALIGAKAGALKGALVGKAIIAGKLALAKKAAVKTTALALKPFVLIGGAKAKLAAIKLAFLGKTLVAGGALAAKAGASIKTAGAKLNGLTSNIGSHLKVPSFTLPQLPALPVVGKSDKKGPTSIEYSLVVNGPHTGLKSKKASFYSSNRRRREAEAEPEPQQANAQQLLQLVRSQNAQQCLQKVICELSANPNAYGSEGIRFGRSLIMLESQTDRTSAAQYRQAATTGSQVQNEQFCGQFFPTCAFQSNEIVRIGNQMIGG